MPKGAQPLLAARTTFASTATGVVAMIVESSLSRVNSENLWVNCRLESWWDRTWCDGSECRRGLRRGLSTYLAWVNRRSLVVTAR